MVGQCDKSGLISNRDEGKKGLRDKWTNERRDDGSYE